MDGEREVVVGKLDKGEILVECREREEYVPVDHRLADDYIDIIRPFSHTSNW